MKKIVMAAVALTLVVGLGSCKSKKSAYRKAYEEAKQREIATQAQDVKVTYEEPKTTTPSTSTNIAVRKERVSVLDGENSDHLKRYSVVIGSFQNPTNARALREKMSEKGYNAVLAKNEMGMLRVIVASFATREEAAASREAIKSRFAPDYKDAWILANE